MRKLLFIAFLLLCMQHLFSQAGQLDPSYGNGGITVPISADVNFNDMVVQPDGKIVAIGGIFTQENGGMYKSYIVRYTTDGKLDKTFSGDGMLSDPFLHPDDIAQSALAVQKDGKILAAGPNFGVVRYNSNGTPDKSFGNGGYVTTDPIPGLDNQDQAVSIAVTKDGKILVSGNHYEDNGGAPHASLVTYSPNGMVESIQVFYSGFDYEAYPNLAAYKSGGYVTLGHGDKKTPYLYSSKFGQATLPLPNPYGPVAAKLVILENKKIAFVVYHRNEADETGTYLAVVNTDGTLDKSFSGDGVLENTGSSSIAAQKDGKILVGDGGHIIKRYNSDGTLDLTITTPRFIEGPADIVAYGNRIYALGRDRVAAFQTDNNPRTVKVNLYGGTHPYNNGEWNNWNTFNSLNAGTLYYSDSTASSVTAVLSKRDGVIDNSTSYSGGMAPVEVLRYGSYATSSRTLTLSGLSTARRYSIELYASRNAYNTDSTIFSINGVLKKIGTYRNFTNKAVFTNLSPNAQGQLVITLANTKTYNYLNGFILDETYNAPVSGMQERTAASPNERISTSDLQVLAFPNPSQKSFTVQLRSSSDTPVQLRVFDAAGKLIESKQNIASNHTLSVGDAYKAGTYYIETVQNGQRKLIKLVKN